MGKIDSLISLARGQVGVSEQPPGSNRVVYNTDYYGREVSGPEYPWCCAFIWWLFWVLKILEDFCAGQKTAYCPYVVSYAKMAGRWVVNGYQPGDLLLYDWDGDGIADHIGLCVGTDGNTLATIEGNVGDSVQELHRTIGSVMGAYRPEYSEMPTEETPEPPATYDELYTIQPGDCLWNIARRFGTTVEAIVDRNKIPDPDRIMPGQTIWIPERDWVPEEPVLTPRGKLQEAIRELQAAGYGVGEILIMVRELLGEEG